MRSAEIGRRTARYAGPCKRPGVLDLAGIDILAAADDHVLAPTLPFYQQIGNCCQLVLNQTLLCGGGAKKLSFEIPTAAAQSYLRARWAKCPENCQLAFRLGGRGERVSGNTRLFVGTEFAANKLSWWLGFRRSHEKRVWSESHRPGPSSGLGARRDKSPGDLKWPRLATLRS